MDCTWLDLHKLAKQEMVNMFRRKKEYKDRYVWLRGWEVAKMRPCYAQASGAGSSSGWGGGAWIGRARWSLGVELYPTEFCLVTFGLLTPFQHCKRSLDHSNISKRVEQVTSLMCK